MDRNSVVVYREFLDAILTLPPEDAGGACIAYFDYAFNGHMYSGDNVVISALMAMSKPRIDADQAKFDKKVGQTRTAANTRWDKAKNADVCGRIDSHTKKFGRIDPHSEHEHEHELVYEHEHVPAKDGRGARRSSQRGIERDDDPDEIVRQKILDAL